MTTSLIYLSALGVITVGWVSHSRQLRRREFLARRRIEEMHRFAVEEVLCRHLPPRYVESVLAGEQLLDVPPARRCLTIVFADIVAFTPLSDALSPDELARAMAQFYDRTAAIAFENRATIDKFVGDSVMAILGAPEPLPPDEQARRALATARAWQTAVRDILPGHRALRLRIGIHQDDIAVGSFGGRHRTDYTVLGLGVNIAARLESVCPPGSILMSERVFAQLDPAPDARHMGALELRGVPRPVSAFAVVSEP
jgi:class 3 adenylate cyclase